ncbi:hypothetical protein [Microbacterium sp. YY-01]|uniref:hypothetical protein n=1 Tax=Microbacterium sp. YY-01 TaxID=3421634 RepID=UPI003D1741D0
MRIGVYIDGYNLYYGGRGICGRSTAGWRWLDIMSLAKNLVSAHSRWIDPTIEMVTYCTARISGASNPQGQREQDVYLRALEQSGAVTHIAVGNYVARIATAPLAVASHLLIDVLTRAIGAALAISSDSDLAFPINYVRDLVPVGLISPKSRKPPKW